MTIVSGGERSEDPPLDRLDDRSGSCRGRWRVARAAGEERVAGEEHRGALDEEAHRTRRVTRGVDRAQTQPADLEHVVVLEQQVVGREHGGVRGSHRHLVAGVAELRDRLDVVPVAVGLDDLAHAEALAELEQLLVLVGGVDEQGVAGLPAAHDEDVVVQRSDDDLVDLDLLVLVVHDVLPPPDHRCEPGARPWRGGIDLETE